MQSSVIHARFNKHNHNHHRIIIIIIAITALRSRSGERCVIIRASSCHLEQMPFWQNSYMYASISIVYLLVFLYIVIRLFVFGISGCVNALLAELLFVPASALCICLLYIRLKVCLCIWYFGMCSCLEVQRQTKRPKQAHWAY